MIFALQIEKVLSVQRMYNGETLRRALRERDLLADDEWLERVHTRDEAALKVAKMLRLVLLVQEEHAGDQNRVLHVMKFEQRHLVLLVRVFHATHEAAGILAFRELALVAGENDAQRTTQNSSLFVHVGELLSGRRTEQKEGGIDETGKVLAFQQVFERVAPLGMLLQTLANHFLDVKGFGAHDDVYRLQGR